MRGWKALHASFADVMQESFPNMKCPAVDTITEYANLMHGLYELKLSNRKPSAILFTAVDMRAAEDITVLELANINDLMEEVFTEDFR
jgi:hypothetical protein